MTYSEPIFFKNGKEIDVKFLYSTVFFTDVIAARITLNLTEMLGEISMEFDYINSRQYTSERNLQGPPYKFQFEIYGTLTTSPEWPGNDFFHDRNNIMSEELVCNEPINLRYDPDYQDWSADAARDVFGMLSLRNSSFPEYIGPGTFYLWLYINSSYSESYQNLADTKITLVPAFVKKGVLIKYNNQYVKAFPYVKYEGKYQIAEPYVRYNGYYRKTTF